MLIDDWCAFILKTFPVGIEFLIVYIYYLIGTFVCVNLPIEFLKIKNNASFFCI